MSADIEEGIDKDDRDMQRMATAFERIANTLAQFYNKMYPPKHEPGDVTLTHIATEEDKIREAQGATEETTDQWLDIGPRERALLESPQPKPPRRASRGVAKASRASSIERKP